MSTKNPYEIVKEAKKVSSLIANARRLMAENKNVDLSNMEHKISILCQKVKKTDLKQKKHIQGILSVIIEDLNLLNEETTLLYKKSGGSLLEDNIKRAIDAYGPDDKES